METMPEDRAAPAAVRPVVYLPTWASWDQMKQRPQYILETFVEHGHEVYFVDFASEPNEADGVRIVSSLDDVPTENVILYIHYAPVAHLIEGFTDPIVIYDILDDLSLYEADEDDLPLERTVRANHDALIRSADVVIASNAILLDRHRAERSEIILVENGVDIARFSVSTERPSDLPTGSPVIGYNGMISTWFAFDLLADLGRLRPEWAFVLVGPVDDRVRDRLDDLLLVGSVIWLGERPSAEMPAYARAFDVGAVWFEVDHMTEAVTPLKLFEYLAAGTPAVSTPLPAARGIEGVGVSSTSAGLGDVVQHLIETGRFEGDVSRASWTARCAPLHRRLAELSAGSA